MQAITEKGFKRPLYEEILAEQIDRAKALFGEDIETSETSVLGKFIRLQAYDLSKAYEELEICYYSRFPNTAVGVALDRLCVFAGITRNPPTQAVHTVVITGTAGATIPAGFVVGTANGITFITTIDYAVGSDSTVTCKVYCTELGTVGNVSVGDITEIINPSADVTSIQHTEVYELAVDEETDVSLRERFTQAIRGTGAGTLSSIRAALLAVDGVKDCVIIENDTDVTVDGRPPHSFECIVSVPSSQSQEIAQTILDTKPVGILSTGNETVTVQDDNGNNYDIKFSFVETVNVYANIVISADDDFSGDSINNIKALVAEKINSARMGEDIILTSLYSSIFTEAGVKDVTTLTLSTDNVTYTAANVAIADTQTAVAQTITVTTSG